MSRGTARYNSIWNQYVAKEGVIYCGCINHFICSGICREKNLKKCNSKYRVEISTRRSFRGKPGSVHLKEISIKNDEIKDKI